MEIRDKTLDVAERISQLAKDGRPTGEKRAELKALVDELKGIFLSVANENRVSLSRELNELNRKAAVPEGANVGIFSASTGIATENERSVWLSFDLNGPYHWVAGEQAYPGIEKTLHLVSMVFSMVESKTFAPAHIEVSTSLTYHYAKNHRFNGKTLADVYPGETAEFSGALFNMLAEILNYSPQDRWEATSPVGWELAERMMDSCQNLITNTRQGMLPFIRDDLGELANAFMKKPKGRQVRVAWSSMIEAVHGEISVQAGSDGNFDMLQCPGVSFTLQGSGYSAAIAADPENRMIYVERNGIGKAIALSKPDGRENTNALYCEMIELAVEFDRQQRANRKSD